jgi:hypothetical protein
MEEGEESSGCPREIDQGRDHRASQEMASGEEIISEERNLIRWTLPRQRSTFSFAIQNSSSIPPKYETCDW